MIENHLNLKNHQYLFNLVQIVVGSFGIRTKIQPYLWSTRKPEAT